MAECVLRHGVKTVRSQTVQLSFRAAPLLRRGTSRCLCRWGCCMRAAWARVVPGCGRVGLGAWLLAAACLVALLLVALFPATDLPPSATTLALSRSLPRYAQGRMSIHGYCVLVVRAWTYEYGLNQIYVGVVFTGNRPPVFPPRRFTLPPMYHERGLNSSGG